MRPHLSPEGWKTTKAAILSGWGPTLRLMLILLVIFAVPAALTILTTLMVVL